MIWFLHGMLGCGEDLRWSGTDQIRRENLWNQVSPFEDWAEQFCKSARDSSPHEERPVLVGYSMGGRLALHALLADPDLWRAAVIISAHPGLRDPGERKARLLADANWAKAAKEMEWSAFLDSWNSQEVFAGTDVMDRRDLEQHREAIARAFDIWSLGRQESLSDQISDLDLPFLWITGERDEKFSKLAEGIEVEHDVAPGCGHRVLVENPEWLERRILEFVRG